MSKVTFCRNQKKLPSRHQSRAISRKGLMLLDSLKRFNTAAIIDEDKF
jgi:hypothetical protein